MPDQSWRFKTLPRTSWVTPTAREVIQLKRDSWNDFGFGTTFHLFVSIGDLEPVEVGTVKIARRDMQASDDSSTVYTPMPDGEFQRLGDEYISVGQDASYYEELISLLGYESTRQVLDALQDLALVPARMTSEIDLEVVSSSLFRNLGTSTVSEQFHRIVNRGVEKVADFELSYFYKGADERRAGPIRFRVQRDSFPPSNVHVLIGANGAGKTRALRDMREYFDNASDGMDGQYLTLGDGSEVAGVVYIGFSAFERQTPPANSLTKIPKFAVVDVSYRPNIALSADFALTLEQCLNGGPDRRRRLAIALGFLEADSLLKEMQISNLDELLDRVDFDTLSSGHKIVLLTVINLVLVAGEKSLILIDEPETHLHPPLLAALIRAISWLTSDSNSVAIVATHSPIVVQEVPKHCAWRIVRSGFAARIDPISIETFGENVGVLTQEVFRLEMRRSGYYSLLNEVARQSASYEEAESKFGRTLGEEARILLRRISRDHS